MAYDKFDILNSTRRKNQIGADGALLQDAQGETEDNTIADLAVAFNTGLILWLENMILP